MYIIFMDLSSIDSQNISSHEKLKDFFKLHSHVPVISIKNRLQNMYLKCIVF